MEETEAGVRLLTPTEAAAIARCSVKTVYAWAARGDIPRVKLGRLVRFYHSDVMAWISQHHDADG